MATLSLREIAESQLSDTPIIDGQLVCCLDTGRFYRDTGSVRVELEADIICVSSLPLAPITDKFYLVRPDELYFYDGVDWYPLSHTHLNKDILDKIEVALTEESADRYEEAYAHSLEPHAPADAEANVIEKVQENGTDLQITDKTVNVTVPTKVSELENDEGFDKNTTYVLETNKSAENGKAELDLTDNEGHSDVVSIQGTGLTTVTTDANGILTINTETPDDDGMYAESTYDKGPAIRVVLDDGDTSVEKTYYLPFISESDSSLLGNDGIIYKTYTSEYDTDAVAILGTGVLGKMQLGSTGWEDGYGTLILGNNITSGTAGNKYGAIQLYGASSNSWTIYGGKSITSDYVLFMPRSSGCLVVYPDDIQTGDNTTPIYISSDGVATPFENTIGAASQPVYVNNGAITPMNEPLSIAYGGTGSQFGHMDITLDDNTESTDRLTFGESNSFTIIDSITRDEFGHVTSINVETMMMPVESVGSGINPIYFSDGAPVASSSTIGSTTQPVYLNNGTITAITQTVGGTAQPVYVNGGVLTVLSQTVGASNQPVWLNSGTITAITQTVGDSIQPIYLNGGVITVCDELYPPISEAEIDALF